MEWRRVHRPLRGVKTIAIISVLAIIAAIVLIYAWLLAFSETAFTVAMYTAVGATLMSVWAWRRWSYGVFLDEGSMRITYVSGTVLFALRDIVGIDVRPSIQRGQLETSAKCLWILTRDGTAVETPVVRGRPRLGVYVDKRPARLYLIEPVFDAVVVELTDELQRRPR